MKRRISVPLSLRAFPNVAVRIRQLLCCSLLSSGLLMAGHGKPQALTDRLELPAGHSSNPTETMLNSLVSTEARLVAAGSRGHILWSEQGSNVWQQARVPVSSDLTALQFVDHLHGWAVGHDGVILHSRNGGESWELQMDGHRVAELLQLLAEQLDSELQSNVRADLERAAQQGVDQSLLAVYFSDLNNGVVVGANNLALQTRDGGESWEVISHHIPNPRGLHLYGVQEAFGSIFIVGEQGLILKRETASDYFEPLVSPYQGSWFGILGRAHSLLVYGLRGNSWITTDGGRSWRKSEINSPLAITAMSAVTDRELFAVSLGGEVFQSWDGGRKFVPVELSHRYPFFAVAPSGGGGAVVAGINGVLLVEGNERGKR